MFCTLSVQKATSRKPNLILSGILYLSNDSNTYDETTRNLVNNLYILESPVSYETKLKVWTENQIGVKAVCFCDTTYLFERNQFGRDEVVIVPTYPAPVYEKVFNMEPSTSFEVVQLNICNINIAMEYIGNFETYKTNTLLFTEQHKRSSSLIEWLNKEILEAENRCRTPKDRMSFSIPSQVSYWYSAFNGYKESLNSDDYKIWLPQLPYATAYKEDFFGRSAIQMKLPTMCFELTQNHYIMSAAEGYLYTKKIPFLKQLRNDFMNELYPESLATSENLPEKEEQEVNDQNRHLAKLTWQGDKKVLINALRQLKTAHNKKGQGLIKESYEDIAIFLIQHVNGFENDKISTLRGQLTKQMDDPKGNFIPLDLSKSN